MDDWWNYDVPVPPPPELPLECQDAGQYPYPFRRPGHARVDDWSDWEDGWLAGVQAQPKLIAQVQAARQAGHKWPLTNWSPVKRLQYLAGPARHAWAWMKVAQKKRHPVGFEQKYGVGQAAEDLCYVLQVQSMFELEAKFPNSRLWG